jgi:hypothetical protein
MPKYKIITLVDITNPRNPRDDRDPLRVGQQSNFNTLCQTVGLRSNYTYHIDPKQGRGGLPMGIDGKATYWQWDFETERDSVYEANGDSIALLKDDLQGVPVIDQLNNSVDITPAVFQTSGAKQNIWIFDLDKLDK